MTHLTHSNETVPMKTTEETYKSEHSALEGLSGLFKLLNIPHNQGVMYNKEYYGTSRINPGGWKFHYDRSEDIMQEPTKFNVEIDFYEQLECKKEKETDMSRSNWFIGHFDPTKTKYVCSNCDQELIYNRKDDFRYCPACTKGYRNG